MKFLEEVEGNPSSMRLMCMMSLWMAFAAAVGTFITDIDTSAGLTITGMFLAGAFAPKAVQKFAEK